MRSCFTTILRPVRLAEGFELIEGDIADEAQMGLALAGHGRGDPLCRSRLHRRVGREPTEMFPEQCSRWAQPAELRAGRGYPAFRVFFLVRGVWLLAADSDAGADAAGAGKSLWRVQSIFENAWEA
ncbi:MAG TPA: hypothetical protein VIX14_03030 [Terriglobales bacterium]